MKPFRLSATTLKLVDLFRSKKEDEVATYEEIEKVVGFDIRENGRRCYLYSAQNILEREDGIHLGTQTSIGYKILKPNEAVDKVEGNRYHLARKTKRAGKTASRVDWQRLDEKDQKRLMRESIILNSSYQFFKATKPAIKLLEAAGEMKKVTADKLIEAVAMNKMIGKRE